nr:recombinase family protein [Rhizobium sp. T1473]
MRLVYDKYTVDGLSIGAIARLLREMGLPTRRRVTRWERSVVWAILRNPAYKGTACFNKTQVGARQKVTRPSCRKCGYALSRQPAVQHAKSITTAALARMHGAISAGPCVIAGLSARTCSTRSSGRRLSN